MVITEVKEELSFEEEIDKKLKKQHKAEPVELIIIIAVVFTLVFIFTAVFVAWAAKVDRAGSKEFDNATKISQETGLNVEYILANGYSSIVEASLHEDLDLYSITKTNFGYILIDKETGVNYMAYEGKITPRYSPNGELYITNIGE